jgi:hypothetical protein
MKKNENIQDAGEQNSFPSWLEQLVSHTFAKLACPMNNNGMYAELQRLVEEAYNLGRWLGNRNLALPGYAEGVTLENKTLIISHPGQYLPAKDTNNEAALD